jgi:hypothetical protein
MKTSKIWIWSSALAALLMAWVSYRGISSSATYGEETLNWAAQATGQDYVNLFLAAPLLLICAYFLLRGSLRAYLVWLGVLIYMVYSYILYAFFVHFGPNFLVYVAILGLSFYSAVGSLMEFDLQNPINTFFRARVAYARILLGAIGILFYFLWLSDIWRALSTDSLPSGVSEIGTSINPIHVLDMAFILPGALITAYLLGEKKLGGYLFAVPLLTFFTVMGVAIIAMFRVLADKGFPSAPAQSVLMGLIALLSVVISYDFLRGVSEQD